jgi:hypothetical protein
MEHAVTAERCADSIQITVGSTSDTRREYDCIEESAFARCDAHPL